MNKEIDVFNWSKYDDGFKGESRLTPNKKISGQNVKNICFSREPYAQELFNIFSSSKFVNKDLTKGDCVCITNIYNTHEDKVIIELLGGLSVEIDLTKEKKFIQLYGYEIVNDFIKALSSPNFVSEFISGGVYAYVIESSPLKISLWQGHIKKIKEEFMQQIQTPSKAYIAKIMEANKGGFFVEVQGVDAFMPGSLAAPNKIVNFQSYVGKEVIVMIEDFLTDINSFIVSHKKYIDYILPTKLAELNIETKYKGTITGTSKYGIFIEFQDIFTGLLHNSKMKEETLNTFRNEKFNQGDSMEFYINEITKDNRIILTEESPDEKKNKFNKFIEENEGKVLTAEVVAIMNFGIIVSTNDLSGLILNKELKKNKIMTNNYIVGDSINVVLDDVKDDKIFFRLPINENKNMK
jgi:predicted RNA-binding protein with RPS1 domain